MLTKETTPIFSTGTNQQVVGTMIEYRLFGILLYRKTMFNPSYYGITEWEFIHRI